MKTLQRELEPAFNGLLAGCWSDAGDALKTAHPAYNAIQQGWSGGAAYRKYITQLLTLAASPNIKSLSNLGWGSPSDFLSIHLGSHKNLKLAYENGKTLYPSVKLQWFRPTDKKEDNGKTIADGPGT